MKNTFLVVFLFAFHFVSSAQVDVAYKKSVRKMFEASGADETYKVAVKQIVKIFKDKNTAVKPELWDEMEKEFMKTSIDTLAEMLAPVYIKYMTQADLEEMIKFYQSPTGKKFAQYTPLITQESMQIGQQWGMKLGQAIDARIKAGK